MLPSYRADQLRSFLASPVATTCKSSIAQLDTIFVRHGLPTYFEVRLRCCSGASFPGSCFVSHSLTLSLTFPINLSIHPSVYRSANLSTSLPRCLSNEEFFSLLRAPSRT